MYLYVYVSVVLGKMFEGRMLLTLSAVATICFSFWRPSRGPTSTILTNAGRDRDASLEATKDTLRTLLVLRSRVAYILPALLIET